MVPRQWPLRHAAGRTVFIRNIAHASLWSGTAASWVDLHPANWDWSEGNGISDTQQVGQVLRGNVRQVRHAALWSGTAASFVDLHPAGFDESESSAYGATGTQQVGRASGRAGLWNGTADSWVDLGPGAAYATSGTQQAGSAFFGACLWSGTADSRVDLAPAGATSSSAYGIFGQYQVGFVSFSGGWRASLWSGTADSWEDLSLALTGSWDESLASDVWINGNTLYVSGYGYNLSTARYEALLWSRPVPEPSALSLLALGGLWGLRRRWASATGDGQ
ncbi:MAG TPA: PEP-CTERM sorting domain-containing protein [Tepidisphaeraceae bacterium]|nr:PEP-CTERM sorting domain-containing protein [Tepidisphaeraceae bacterium]